MKQIVLILACLLPFCSFAQFTESFSGDLLPPEWEGNTDLFRIQKNTLRLEGKEGGGRASLYRTYTALPDMQWTFDLLLDVNPSSQNRILVYPCYHPENSRYVYLVVGGNKNADLKLLRNGGEPVLSSKPRELPYPEFPCVLSVRLTYGEGGTWTLYSSFDRKTYTREGEGTYEVDNPDPEVRFHLQMEYTKTRRQAFGADNISAAAWDGSVPEEPENPEEPEEPENPEEESAIAEISYITETRLLLEFYEEVDYADAKVRVADDNPAVRFQYYLPQAGKNRIMVFFAQPLDQETTSVLHVEGFRTLDGTLLPPEDFVLDFDTGGGEDPDPEEPEEKPIPPGSVVISEVMADPPRDGLYLPETEYVELQNRLDRPVTLDGWELIYRGSQRTDLSGVTIPAGSYRLLYRSGDPMTEELAPFAVPLDDFPASLNNEGQTLALSDAEGRMADEVTYPEAEPGISWERGSDGWHLSSAEEGGTPGAENTVSSGDGGGDDDGEEGEDGDTGSETDVPEQAVIINELLPDPLSGGSEYVELYNRSAGTLDLSGLALSTRRDDGSLKTEYPLGAVTLAAGAYLVLTKNPDGVAGYYHVADEACLREMKMPVLANDGASVVLLRRSDKKVIDEVAYSPDWHSEAVRDEKGVALERIDPDGDSQSAGNWTSASEASGYGTPGAENSQYLAGPDGDRPLSVEKPVYNPADGSYHLDYRLDKSGYQANLRIYDLGGRLLAEPARQTLVGTEGSFVWNGKGADGNSLPSGVYILYLEMYHPEGGEVRRQKQAFLVH